MDFLAVSSPELFMLYPSELIFKHHSVITFLWMLNYRLLCRNILFQ